MRKILLWTTLCALAAFPALAAKPAELASYIHASRPYGQATLNKLWLKVYDATLWTDARTWSMDAPFALTLRYHMHFDADELIDRTIAEIRREHTVPESALPHYRVLLTRVFAPVEDGDTITALNLPHRETVFYHNGEKTGEIRDPAFADSFFAIWLSPDSSEPEMQQELLPAPQARKEDTSFKNE